MAQCLSQNLYRTCYNRESPSGAPCPDLITRTSPPTTEPPTCDDVISLLRTVDRDVELNEAIVDSFNAAGPLLMMCVHLLVPQTLMRNPEEFAQKARRNVTTQAFKEDSSLYLRFNYPAPQACPQTFVHLGPARWRRWWAVHLLLVLWFLWGRTATQDEEGWWDEATVVCPNQ